MNRGLTEAVVEEEPVLRDCGRGEREVEQGLEINTHRRHEVIARHDPGRLRNGRPNVAIKNGRSCEQVTERHLVHKLRLSHAKHVPKDRVVVAVRR